MAPTKSAKRIKLETAFEFMASEKCYKCTNCNKSLEGVKSSNFLTGAERHIQRCNPAFFNESNQLLITSMRTLTNDVNASRLEMVRKFSKTTIPINIFRSKPNRVFLQAVQKLSSVPDYKTVESDVKKMETYCLSVLKGAYHYGVQFDHWKDNKSSNILVILVSFLTENYQPVVQVIDFKNAESGRAITTSRELEKTLRDNNLDPQNCQAYQSDNCNAMIAACREFRQSI